MKRITTLVFAIALVFSIAFIGEVIPSGNSFSAQAQTVKTKRRKKGVIRKSYAGGKYVTKKVYSGGKWVTKKVWVGTKTVGKKSYKTGRKVVSRSKKIVY